MKTYPDIDYDYRPSSYWDGTDLLEAILKGVTGTERRKIITDAWNVGRLDRLPREYLEPSLDDEARSLLGQIHPAFMGGEYLPPVENDDSEIVRIELRSTTSDVISVRARRSGKRIRYAVVDEYGTEFEFQPGSSHRPFSLRQLIRFLDNARHPDLCGALPLAFNEMNAESGCRRDFRYFTSISSEIYTDLAYHYEGVFEDWAQDQELEEERKLRIECEDVDEFIDEGRCFYCGKRQSSCRHLLAVIDRRAGAFRTGSLQDLFREVEACVEEDSNSYTFDEFCVDLGISASYHFVRKADDAEVGTEGSGLDYFWGNFRKTSREIREQMSIRRSEQEDDGRS
jgi:hypothetical protein